jgi:CHAT domain
VPTSMSVYAGIAARHGIDPADDEAVDDFFATTVPAMPAETQELILAELLSQDGNDMMSRKKVLVIASNPAVTSPLELAAEAKVLKTRLEDSLFHDSFDVVSAQASHADDLLFLLKDQSPAILHFMGHGPIDGLVLKDNSEHEMTLTGKDYTEIFGGSHLELVVMSGCYSGGQAAALEDVVPSVVGTTANIGNDVARLFAAAFYGAIGDGLSIREALRNGETAATRPGTEDVIHSGGDLDVRLVG